MRALGVRGGAGFGRPLVLGALAASASVALLALSGWFLTAAALAAMAGPAAVAVFNYLLPSVGIRALAIVRTAARYGERLTAHAAALNQMAGLRARLFGGLVARDGRVAPDLSGGDASARLIGDIEVLESLIIFRSGVPAAVIGGVIGGLFVLIAGWRAALAYALLAVAGLGVAMLLGRRWVGAAARDAAVARGDLRARYVELAAARSEIMAYGLYDRVGAMLEAPAAALDRATLALGRAESAAGALLTGWAGMIAAAIVALGSGSPAVVALAGLAGYAGAEALFASLRASLRQAAAAEGLARLELIAAAPVAGVEEAPPHAPATLAIGMSIVAPGGRIVLTGRSGAGKTMLLEALAGMRPARAGVLVGGVPLGALSHDALTRQCALAPQSPQLIAGTIADNLRLARPGVTAADMAAALETACLADRVAAMPLGLDTPVGEGGGVLSGGEQKRLALARALLAGRPWLLADEPSEGLDPATEARLVERLDAWLAATGTGLVLVSHRAAPRRLCGQSFALGEG